MSSRVSESKLMKFVNVRTDQGFRAIHYAAFRGNLDMINKLVLNGADVHATTRKGLNLLHIAAQGDQINSLVYFLEKFELKITSEDKFGSTPLHWACFTGSEAIVNFIINRYISEDDINKPDSEGLTPLHLAVMSGKHLNYLKIKYF
jgi:ankyrin repeat protein